MGLLFKYGLRRFFLGESQTGIATTSGMEAPTILYVASASFGLLAISRLVVLREMFKRSRQAESDGCERAAIRERSWYLKTNDERSSTEKTLS
jgi:hypothetical protein